MMNRLLLFVFFLYSSTCISQTVSAELEMPQAVEVGSDFIVKITVKKTDITGFMKFTQKLPENYIATEVDSKGGSFIFKDNVIKILWLTAPKEEEYSFSYKLKVPADAKNEEAFDASIDYTIDYKPASFTFTDKFIRLNQTVKEDIVIEKTPEEIPPPPPVVEKEIVKIENYTYTVQIGAYSSQPQIKGVKELKMIKLNTGITKYFSGNFKTREEAEKRREELKAGGRFLDAFIVKLKDGMIAQ
jgi:hypothetical protein